jgi:hypothetical protein
MTQHAQYIIIFLFTLKGLLYLMIPMMFFLKKQNNMFARKFTRASPKFFMKSFIVVLLTGMLLSCRPIYILAPNNTGYIVRVEADGPWEGLVDHQVVSGFGTKSFPVYPRLHHDLCWRIRKSSPHAGLLRAFLTYRDYHPGSDVHPRFSDTVTLHITGVVHGCHRVM